MLWILFRQPRNIFFLLFVWLYKLFSHFWNTQYNHKLADSYLTHFLPPDTIIHFILVRISYFHTLRTVNTTQYWQIFTLHTFCGTRYNYTFRCLHPVTSTLLERSIYIAKTSLFKYTENFTTKKKWKFSDKNSGIFLISAQKHRLWVLVSTASPRRF